MARAAEPPCAFRRCLDIHSCSPLHPLSTTDVQQLRQRTIDHHEWMRRLLPARACSPGGTRPGYTICSSSALHPSRRSKSPQVTGASWLATKRLQLALIELLGSSTHALKHCLPGKDGPAACSRSTLLHVHCVLLCIPLSMPPSIAHAGSTELPCCRCSALYALRRALLPYVRAA
jgi:hypothetical protein